MSTSCTPVKYCGTFHIVLSGKQMRYSISICFMLRDQMTKCCPQCMHEDLILFDQSLIWSHSYIFYSIKKKYIHSLICVRLHMLTELEEMVSGLLCFNPSTSEALRSSNRRVQSASQQVQSRPELEGQWHRRPLDVGELVDLWDKRLKLIQTSHRCLEPILSFRR